MFFIRLLFWVTVVAIFLPPDLREEIFSFSGPSGNQASYSDSSYRPSSFDPAGADRLVPYLVENATTFCERQKLACEMGEAAMFWVHEQAVAFSGHLHEWLQHSLETRRSNAAHAV